MSKRPFERSAIVRRRPRAELHTIHTAYRFLPTRKPPSPRPAGYNAGKPRMRSRDTNRYSANRFFLVLIIYKHIYMYTRYMHVSTSVRLSRLHDAHWFEFAVNCKFFRVFVNIYI